MGPRGFDSAQSRVLNHCAHCLPQRLPPGKLSPGLRDPPQELPFGGISRPCLCPVRIDDSARLGGLSG